MEKKNFTIKLNNNSKIEALLQETYDMACRQYKQLQDEINKISNSTVVNNLDIDGKEKYGKIVNNYITTQQKSIAQKIDIAKLMVAVASHDGDVDGALKEMKKEATTLDISKLRKMVKDASTPSDDKTEEYTLKK